MKLFHLIVLIWWDLWAPVITVPILRPLRKLGIKRGGVYTCTALSPAIPPPTHPRQKSGTGPSVKFRPLTGCVALEKWFNLSEPRSLLEQEGC